MSTIAEFQEAVRLNPSQPAAHNNLGNAFLDQGRLAEAAKSFRQALRLNSEDADAHNNLGIALFGQGQSAEAAECFRQALRISPDYANAHNNLGNALKIQGQSAEAAQCYRRTLSINPNHAPAHNNLGLALFDQGQMVEAAQCFWQALQINPTYPNAIINLGNIFFKQGQLGQAADYYRKALRLNRNHVEAHLNLGNTLFGQEDLAGAAECYRQALALNPKHADAHGNLGNALLDLGQPAEAALCFREALARKPNHGEALNNLGIALKDQGQLAEADDCFRQAIGIDASSNTARLNRAVLRLQQGDYQGGWPDYEERLKVPGIVERTFQQPRWDGSPLEGKTLLVYDEQGLGDTMQFLRFLPQVQRGGGTVILECQPAILKLLTGLGGVDRVVSAGTPLPPFDVHIPLLSLPGLLGTTLATLPTNIPYLTADPKLVDYWRRELDGGEWRVASGEDMRSLSPPKTRHLPLKIGIAWQANPKHKGYRQRSIPLKHFEVLAQMENVRLVSLQKGPGMEQIASWAGKVPLLDLSDRLDTKGAFLDTAAVMKNLDLVVTLDSAVAHLAGALGVPAWVVLPLVPDWRWLLDRPDSPWYPSLRLFRQKKLGDWGEVFERIEKELRVRR